MSLMKKKEKSLQNKILESDLNFKHHLDFILQKLCKYAIYVLNHHTKLNLNIFFVDIYM